MKTKDILSIMNEIESTVPTTQTWWNELRSFLEQQRNKEETTKCTCWLDSDEESDLHGSECAWRK